MRPVTTPPSMPSGNWTCSAARAARSKPATRSSTPPTADLGDVEVSLVAELSRSYFELRGDQQRLAVAQRNVANQTETLTLTQARLEGGAGTELDTSRATAQLACTRASIAPLQAAVARAIHRLGVLSGLTPDALRAELELPGDLPAGAGDSPQWPTPRSCCAAARTSASRARAGRSHRTHRRRRGGPVPARDLHRQHRRRRRRASAA